MILKIALKARKFQPLSSNMRHTSDKSYLGYDLRGKIHIHRCGKDACPYHDKLGHVSLTCKHKRKPFKDNEKGPKKIWVPKNKPI